MTRIAPCTRCPLSKGCTQRDQFRKMVRSIPARSIRFNCAILKAEVRPGRRIVIRHPMVAVTYSPYDGEEHNIRHVEVNATISNARNDYSFSAIIDAGQIGGTRLDDGEAAEDLTLEEINVRRFRRTQPHIRIVRFLDEPDRQICGFGNLMRPEGGCEQSAGDGECHCAESRCVTAGPSMMELFP